MQVKTFRIPLMGAESIEEEVNTFLRSHRVLTVDRQFSPDGGGYWTLLVTWQENGSPGAPTPRGRSQKTDYREVLEPEAFARFARFRDIRREISKRENIPAYAVFTDEELSQMAQLTELSVAGIRTIKGVGKRAEKYGSMFLANEASPADFLTDDPFSEEDETPQPFDA